MAERLQTLDRAKQAVREATQELIKEVGRDQTRTIVEEMLNVVDTPTPGEKAEPMPSIDNLIKPKAKE